MRRIVLLFAALLAYAGLALAAVNVNTATKEQLESLNGIGPVKAQAIIDYRAKNGPFKKLEDLKNVDGIGDATFDKIKADVSLSGRTEAKAAAADKKADPAPAKPEKAKAEDKKPEPKAKDEPKKDDKKPEKAKKEDKAKDEPKKDDKKSEKAKKEDKAKDEPKKDAKKSDGKKDKEEEKKK